MPRQRARSGPHEPRRGRSGQDSTRQRFVTAAANLFWQRGYSATSMSDILAEAESSAGNLYNYFSSKEALLTDAIGELEHRIVREAIDPGATTATDPVDRVVKILEVFRDHLLRSNYQCGSPLGRLAAEFGGSGVGNRRLASAFRRFRAEIGQCVRQLDGSMTSDRADELATVVVALLEGSLLQAQALRSVEPVDVCMRHVTMMLGTCVSSEPVDSPLQRP